MDEIKVKVVEFGDRKHYQMQYVEPVTRKKKTRSTEVEKTGLKRDRTAAERVAAKWEAELREGRHSSSSKTLWSVFRESYETQVLSGLSKRTLQQSDIAFDMLERLLNPHRIHDVTAQRLSWLAAELRKETKVGDKTKPGLSESSIKSYFAHLKAALRWAERVGMISKAPVFPKLQRASSNDSAKGRALSGEEFDRMIAAVPKVVGEDRAAEWQRFLRGLWLSGFRIGESLVLSWDERAGIVVDIAGRNPVAHIEADSQKSHRGETIPLAPEFGELLKAVPSDQRNGFVFSPIDQKGKRASLNVAIRTISDIGRKTNAKTWTNAKSGKTKCATAHDLRRSFGTRWASRVMPAVLQQMMRHASIQTTMRFYVTRNAVTAGDVIREAFEKNQSGNSSGNSAPSAHEKSTHES
jgi:integrase